MTRLFTTTFLSVFLFAISSRAQTIDHWETVVYDASSWHYLSGTDPGGNWRLASFNDNAWPVGQGSVGYGDNDDRTVIAPTLSVIIRTKFTIIDKDVIEKAVLHMDYDDGFIAYLNGVEIARAYMGTNTLVPYDQPSQGLHEAMLFQGGVPEGFPLDKEVLSDLLIEGENVLAIQVHNDNVSSSDLTSAAFFSLGISNSSVTYGALPSWFVEPFEFKSSDLPIIVINTAGQAIMDEVRIVADMGIIDNGSARNNITDPFNNYSGKITVELRGESSQMFPKKSMSVETQDAAGENVNVALLGMPAENDWVLYAPYTDKTMMRDVLAYKIARDMGKYAPRTRYAELVLNGDYQGVYVLIEKIKRDKNRVDIATLNPDDITGDDITGGYVLRVDKIDGNDYPAWTPVPVPQLPNENLVNFQYVDPKGDELVASQRSYIQDYMQRFESSLTVSSFKDPATGYRKYIDLPSFLDFMLVNEVGKNIDGYVFSTYLYKEKDSNGGLLYMGPLWDFNLAFGNVDYLANAQFAPGWMWNDQYRMFWFRRLVSDPYFAGKLKCRWQQLRATTLSDAYFTSAIDDMATTLAEAQQRNFMKWPILGTYVWPNQFVGNTYAEEIGFLKQWIAERLEWMDDNMPGTCPEVITGTTPEQSNRVAVFPNPADEAVTFLIDEAVPGEIEITIHNSIGTLVFNQRTASHEFTWTDKQAAPGLYIIEVKSQGKILYKQRLVKK